PMRSSRAIRSSIAATQREGARDAQEHFASTSRRRIVATGPCRLAGRNLRARAGPRRILWPGDPNVSPASPHRLDLVGGTFAAPRLRSFETRGQVAPQGFAFALGCARRSLEP